MAAPGSLYPGRRAGRSCLLRSGGLLHRHLRPSPPAPCAPWCTWALSVGCSPQHCVPPRTAAKNKHFRERTPPQAVCLRRRCALPGTAGTCRRLPDESPRGMMGLSGSLYSTLPGGDRYGFSDCRDVAHRKNRVARRLLEQYGYPYLSMDHLKMGLIRSGYTSLSPMSSDLGSDGLSVARRAGNGQNCH